MPPIVWEWLIFPPGFWIFVINTIWWDYPITQIWWIFTWCFLILVWSMVNYFIIVKFTNRNIHWILPLLPWPWVMFHMSGCPYIYYIVFNCCLLVPLVHILWSHSDTLLTYHIMWISPPLYSHPSSFVSSFPCIYQWNFSPLPRPIFFISVPSCVILFPSRPPLFYAFCNFICSFFC